MKFGGSSVGDAEMMQRVATIVDESLDRSPLVVLSAMGKTTNALFHMAELAATGDRRTALRELRALFRQHHEAAAALIEGELPTSLAEALEQLQAELDHLLEGVALLRELSPRSMDAIASMGERLSTVVFAAYLNSRGVNVTLVDAREVMRTDGRFGEARPQPAAIRTRATEQIVPHLGPDKVVVVQGYIGATEQGVTTTLGRGGSDYSASLYAAALQAQELQIWTDVEGVLTCDPTIVPDAIPLAELSFAEAAELAAFGAKVLHPATIQPAVEAGILVTVRKTRNPGGKFTSVQAAVVRTKPVLALASRGDITVLTASSTRMLAQSGFLAKLFEVFGRHDVSVDLVATAEVSVSLTVESDVPLTPLLEELGGFARVTVARGRAIVAVVGENLRDTPGVSGRLFRALSDVNVEMISMGANEINLSMVVREEDAPRALRSLHAVLMEDQQ